LAAHCPRELSRSLESAGAHENRGTCLRQCESHRARRPPGSHDQNATAAKLDPSLQGPQYPYVIRIVAMQFSAAPHHNGVYGPNFLGKGIASVKES
jgi:hypothetical protein